MRERFDMGELFGWLLTRAFPNSKGVVVFLLLVAVIIIGIWALG